LERWERLAIVHLRIIWLSVIIFTTKTTINLLAIIPSVKTPEVQLVLREYERFYVCLTVLPIYFLVIHLSLLKMSKSLYRLNFLSIDATIYDGI